MIGLKKKSHSRKWIIPSLLALIITGCGGKDSVPASDRDPGLSPRVTKVSPENDVTEVIISNLVITATFNQAIAIDKDLNVTVTCSTPCINPTGLVAINSANGVVTFTPKTNLAANTLYTVAVTKAKGLTSEAVQESAYVWHFTTGVAPFPITVSAVSPIANTTDVAINNTLVTADFNEPIAPINDTFSFTVACDLPCINPAGKVIGDKTKAVFTLAPNTLLSPSTVYTATIAGATSLATGAAMAAPFIWHFTTTKTPEITHANVNLNVHPDSATPSMKSAIKTPTNIKIVKN